MTDGLPDLRALAETRDLDGRPVHLSLFADLSSAFWKTALDQRRRALLDAVGDDLEPAWDEAFSVLEREAKDPGARGAAVFWHTEDGLVAACSLAAPLPTSAILDSSPYVRPLARFADEHEAFLLVRIDGETASLHVVDEAESETLAREDSSVAGRHKKGGWSQMRFQRARQGAVDRFLDDVIEHVQTAVREEGVERIVLAGPGETKKRLHGRLPRTLEEMVFAVEDLDEDDDETATLRRIIRLANDDEQRDSREVVEALRGAAQRGELAALGPFDTVRAARSGAVEVLVVQEGTVAGGAKRESDETYYAPDDAPADAREVDLIEEAVEHALRTDARVEFCPKDDYLERIGGVGALLRWDLDPTWTTDAQVPPTEASSPSPSR